MNSARDRMLTTTAELLQSQGYHATGLNQIVKESQTPKGSLYHYFPGGKEDLVGAAIQNSGGTISQLIEQASSESSSALGAAQIVIGFLKQALADSDFQKGCPVATVALETVATSDSLQVICRDLYRSWQAPIIAKLLAEGWSETEATSRAAFVLSAIEGAMLLSKCERSVAPMDLISQQLAGVLTK